MFGLGMQELVILGVLGTIAISVPAVIYCVVRAAIGAGNRDSSSDK